MALRFTLRQLEYFDAVAREGSLAAAAERCHVSATAIALALDELERQMAVQLLVRHKGKGVMLTPAGAGLLAHAQQLLSGAENLAAEAFQKATGLRGRFAIGCFPTLAPFFLPGVMDAFRREHAGLDLKFEEATAPELNDQLLQGRVDTAILYSVDVSTQLDFEAIHEYRPHVIVGEGHRLASRSTVKLAELASEPLIQVDMKPSMENTMHIFASLGLRPLIWHITTDYELARCLVGRGLGYSVVIQRPASTLTYDGHRLTTLEIADRLPPTIVGLVRPHGAPRTAKYLALQKFLIAHAKKSTRKASAAAR